MSKIIDYYCRYYHFTVLVIISDNNIVLLLSVPLLLTFSFFPPQISVLVHLKCEAP